jgi:nicotinic acid phosphoribosyltransferase
VRVDSYGVGSTLIRGGSDFTADVFMVDGKSCAEAGRRLGPSPRPHRSPESPLWLRAANHASAKGASGACR